MALELAEDEGVVFLSEPAQQFHADDQEGHADAAGGEHASAGNVPARCEKALDERRRLVQRAVLVSWVDQEHTGVYRVPIP